jgi:hypothetical protein
VDLHTFVADAGLEASLLTEQGPERDNSLGEAGYLENLGAAVVGLDDIAGSYEFVLGDEETGRISFKTFCFCESVPSSTSRHDCISGGRVSEDLNAGFDFPLSLSEVFVSCDGAWDEEESAALSFSMMIHVVVDQDVPISCKISACLRLLLCFEWFADGPKRSIGVS